jgi:hypothetical protein
MAIKMTRAIKFYQSHVFKSFFLFLFIFVFRWNGIMERTDLVQGIVRESKCPTGGKKEREGKKNKGQRICSHDNDHVVLLLHSRPDPLRSP